VLAPDRVDPVGMSTVYEAITAREWDEELVKWTGGLDER
jgi:hypothetical protein